MRCPYCQDDQDKVIDTNTLNSGAAIRRRRHCLACDRRFTTYERVERSPLQVVKKDGRRVPFKREHIRSGLAKACEKRPISTETIDGLVSEVEAELYENYDREVPSRQIGEAVIARLRHIDQVGYVRFASVYREFTDANDFVEEVGPLLSAETAGPFAERQADSAGEA